MPVLASFETSPGWVTRSGWECQCCADVIGLKAIGVVRSDRPRARSDPMPSRCEFVDGSFDQARRSTMVPDRLLQPFHDIGLQTDFATVRADLRRHMVDYD